ncbi:GNAT family N-acetyltransferase [Pseudonocardiaceae bacterium YIM PH 21723]|nr:GNAT family N-acetyltransferase [Pseudonocardiaceae bacterium YIM PH 21723]
MAELVVSAATAEDWSVVTGWANGEGWNVGPGDGTCFRDTDPGGFLVGRLGDRVVTAVSIVNYSPEYAFLGHYLVHPELRGRGLGLATWRAAWSHAGDRVVGLDGVVAQQQNYVRSGFTAAYRNTRFGGRLSARTSVAEHAVPITEDLIPLVAEYDRLCFPADRPEFVRRWTTAPGHVGYALRDGDRITGYGVIRPANAGYKIGPVFADTPADGASLVDSLTAGVAEDSEVYLDIPEFAPAAARAMVERGLTPGFETVRMYTGPVREVRSERIFAGTSLELG